MIYYELIDGRDVWVTVEAPFVTAPEGGTRRAFLDLRVSIR